MARPDFCERADQSPLDETEKLSVPPQQELHAVTPIKRAQPRPQQQGRPQPRPAQKAPVRRDPLPGMGEVLPPSDDRAFEDKLKAFMSESDSKMAGIRQYEHRTKSRRR